MTCYWLIIDILLILWDKSLYLSFRTSLYSCLSFLYRSFCNYCSSELADLCLMLCYERPHREPVCFAKQSFFFNYYMFMHLYITHVSCVLRLELQHLSICICILLFFYEKTCMFHFFCEGYVTLILVWTLSDWN
jgi:hypothetical protein